RAADDAEGDGLHRHDRPARLPVRCVRSAPSFGARPVGADRGAPRSRGAMTASVPIRLLRGVMLPMLLIVLWQVAASQVQQPSQAPTPLRVVLGAEALIASGDLPLAIIQSLGRVFSGFAVAA